MLENELKFSFFSNKKAEKPMKIAMQLAQEPQSSLNLQKIEKTTRQMGLKAVVQSKFV